MAKRKRQRRPDSYSVFGWSADLTGCHYDRHQTPLDALGNTRGWRTDTAMLVKAEAISANRYDLISGQRISTQGAFAFWRTLVHPAAPAFVYEVDDLLWQLDSCNTAEAVEFYGRQDTRDLMFAGMQLADAVTVSTEPLAAEVARITDGPVFVLPNFLPARLLSAPKPKDGPVRVGWAGGASHRGDLALVAGALRDAITPEVAFQIQGFDFREVVGVPHAEHVAWCDDKDAYVRSLDALDVALCPLEATAFTRCKSAVKALEAAFRGVPVVASNVSPYREFVINGVTGFLADTDADWVAALRLLVENRDLRERMGRAAFEQARAWTIERNVTDRAEAYRWVIENKAEIRAPKLDELRRVVNGRRADLPSLA